MTARAGATGGTDPPRTGSALADPMADTLTSDPIHTSPFARASARPSAGHSPYRAFFAWRSGPVRGRARPGRATQVFPRSSPDGAPGVQSLRRFNPAAGWTTSHVLTPPIRRSQISRSRISNFMGPTSLPVRAHMPFVPPRPPRLIFVGVTDRLLETRSAKAIGLGIRMASTSGLHSRLRSAPGATRGPRERSCLGLCLLQGCRALSRASAGLVPGLDHQPPDSGPRPVRFVRDALSYPLMGLRRAFTSSPLSAGRARRSRIGMAKLLSLRGPRLPYSVLMGLMPVRPERSRDR
jgi:hypothetical protein